MAKAKLGSGARFKAVTKSIEKKSGYGEDRAKKIAAAVGMKKYGKVKMQKMAQAGRARKSGRS